MKDIYYRINHYLIFIWSIIYILASVLFFAPVIIDLDILKVFSWFIIIITFLSIVPVLLQKSTLFSNYGGVMKLWVILLIFSVFNSLIQHGQGVMYSIRSIIDFLPISYFFFFYRNNFSFKEIEKHIFLFLFVYILIYLIAYVFTPRVIFDYTGGELDINTQRGVDRIKLLGTGFVYLGYFMSLNKWIIKKKKVYLFIAIIAFVMIILGVSRQHIFFSFLLGLLMVINQLKWYKKILIITFFTFLVIYAINNFQILQILIELTKNQIEVSGTENVRVLAFKHYVMDYNDNIFQVIFGNGIPNLNSTWGINYNNMTKSTGFYPSDVGFAKIFFYWGICGLFLFFRLAYKIFKQKVDTSIFYTKYYFGFIFLTNIASHTFFKEILTVSIIVYILEMSYMTNKIELNNVNN